MGKSDLLKNGMKSGLSCGRLAVVHRKVRAKERTRTG